MSIITTAAVGELRVVTAAADRLTKQAGSGQGGGRGGKLGAAATTPMKTPDGDLRRNVSFDHYFGPYPNVTHEDGTRFTLHGDTPAVNGLTPQLLTDNPNRANPQRLGPEQALTCNQDHGYTAEQ